MSWTALESWTYHGHPVAIAEPRAPLDAQQAEEYLDFGESLLGEDLTLALRPSAQDPSRQVAARHAETLSRIVEAVATAHADAHAAVRYGISSVCGWGDIPDDLVVMVRPSMSPEFMQRLIRIDHRLERLRRKVRQKQQDLIGTLPIVERYAVGDKFRWDRQWPRRYLRLLKSGSQPLIRFDFRESSGIWWERVA